MARYGPPGPGQGEDSILTKRVSRDRGQNQELVLKGEDGFVDGIIVSNVLINSLQIVFLNSLRIMHPRVTCVMRWQPPHPPLPGLCLVRLRHGSILR